MHHTIDIIDNFTISRRVLGQNTEITLEKGDVLVIAHASNLHNNTNLYWIMAINDDWGFSEHPYGYLIDVEEYSSYYSSPTNLIQVNKKELINAIIKIASSKPTSPMEIAQKLNEYSYEVVFNTIDEMQDNQLVYFDVEDDVLLLLN
jgi:hypothetical protein